MANDLHDAITDYLEAQDALDNWEHQSINRPEYSTLMRRRNGARDDLDAALTSPVAPEEVVAGEVSRYSFVCNAGCGVCSVKVKPFEYERTETLEGEHLGSKYRPQVVSSCCGSEVHVYDNDADHWGEEVTLAASPEAAPAAMEGAGPAMQLNATQLRSALEFVAPDFDADEDQREAEVVLQHLPARTSTDGEPMEAGLYCWLAEYPEEGCIPLREDEAFPAATPAAPSADASPDDELLVACITLNGTTLTVEASALADMFGTDDEQHAYELTFKRMTRAAFEALGEFSGF